MNDEIILGFERHCPETYRAIVGKRYLLPTKHQNAYANQDELNKILIHIILGFALGEVPPDDRHRVLQMLSLLQALKYGRQTIYLERDLGEALMRTDLPEDLSTDDVHWAWPAFRVMLPKGLCASEVTVATSMRYLDLCLIRDGEDISLSPALSADLFTGLERDGYDVNRDVFSDAGLNESVFMLTGQVDVSHNDLGPNINTWASSWNNRKLSELISSDRRVIEDSYGVQKAEDLAVMTQAARLALNILLLLSQEPIDFQPEPYIRKPQMVGKHFKPGLVNARFVGDLFPKARVVVTPKKESEEASGITRAAHWVRGHWSRIAHGKGRLLRRLAWIRPYRTGEKEDAIA